MLNTTAEKNRLIRRALVLLAQGRAAIERSARSEQTLLRNARGVIGLPDAELRGLVERGLVRFLEYEVEITEDGRHVARELRATSSGPGREIGETRVETAEGWETVAINLAESPLAQLARRRGRDGRSFLSEAEIRAGERLRADFTRGQIMPRLGANWEASVSAGSRDGRGGIADLTDAALAARQRVEKAVVATGPDLSGVLLDICCFLKGLEQVEAERGWPVRSAKLMLKTALAALDRHYEPARRDAMAGRIIHWGTSDYRPSLG